MAEIDPPDGLNEGGLALWRAVTAGGALDGAQQVLLTEACRAKDRLDEFDSIIHGRGVLQLMRFRVLGQYEAGEDQHLTVEVKFDNVISTANATANLLRQTIGALKLGEAAPVEPAKPKSPLDLVKEQVDELARRRGQSGTAG